MESGQFSKLLDEQAGAWIAAGESPIVMSGMVGSRQGWVEAPYAQCPAGLDELASGLKKVEWGGKQAWIVPGLACRDEAGVYDVMRGEETQILGAMDDLPAECVICLPGTHSKWVVVQKGRILGFKTYFTGEMFAVLRKHSLLGRMMEVGAADQTSFLDGVKRSADPGGLLHHLFGVRTRGLFYEISPANAPSYLSGILIGHELREAAADARKLYLLGSAELTALYGKAARAIGLESKLLDPEAVTRGLFALGRRLTG